MRSGRFWIGVVILLGGLVCGRGILAGQAEAWFESYGVWAAETLMEGWLPAAEEIGNYGGIQVLWREIPLFSWLGYQDRETEYAGDPSQKRLLVSAKGNVDSENGLGNSAAGDFQEDGSSGDREKQEGGKIGEDGTGDGGKIGNGEGTEDGGKTGNGEGTGDGGKMGNGEETGDGEETGNEKASGEVLEAEAIALKPAGTYVIREKLADYDYMMEKFYSVHPTTTAGRDMMSAEKFLKMDFSLDPEAEGPQILIYHTHSQEEFADYPENEEATIVGVGTYLAELLEEMGYQVIHDTSVYDFRDGKLDRSQAYTYALDGITGILQKYPSIEVILDIHRDGVKEGTRLVTEIDGKSTAKIMFFNGTSQSPDGPVEYLPNPNRDANMGFSFQMQLAAAEQFPGFTRKIYLKGLRYNLHLRARSALIEVGAQTNTYEEAKNAMVPLSQLLDQVLRGKNQ